MNGFGLTLVLTAVTLLLLQWGLRWRLERRFMRKIREENKSNSVSALVDSWKIQDKKAMAIAESQRQSEAYYKSLTSVENIGVVNVGSSPFREVQVEDGSKVYTATSTQVNAKIKAGLDRLELGRKVRENVKAKEAAGLGVNLERIGKEFGLSAKEMLEAYKKAEQMVNKNFHK